MPAAATKTVTGVLTNLSAAEITGAELHFDLDPQYVAVGDTIVVGTQSNGTVGELVTPIDPDGSFSVALVAVDNPTWTIKVTVDGPNVETPVAFEIIPPPASGSGSVGIGSLLADASGGTNPVVVASIRGASDYDNTTAPTDGQAPVWDEAEGKFKPGTVSGGGSGTITSVNGYTGPAVNLTFTDVGAAAAGAAPAPHAASHATGGTDPITPDSIGALTKAVADGLYLQTSEGAAPANVSTGTPISAPITSVHFTGTYEPAQTDPDINEVWVGSQLVSWRNEVGSYRSQQPPGHKWDSGFRAIQAAGGQTGHPFEYQSSDRTQVIFGVDGATGQVITSNVTTAPVYLIGSTDPVPSGIPAGSIIARKS